MPHSELSCSHFPTVTNHSLFLLKIVKTISRAQMSFSQNSLPYKSHSKSTFFFAFIGTISRAKNFFKFVFALGETVKYKTCKCDILL